jgi:hypothetical protein
MKIYLTQGAEQNDTMPGYEYVDYKHIKGAAYPAQVDEIYGPTILNHIKLLEATDFLNTCKSLLCVGGKIIVGGVDCYLLSKATLDRSLTEKQYNDLLFSDPRFLAVHSLQAVKVLMQSLGLNIEEIYIEDDEARFSIKATK